MTLTTGFTTYQFAVEVITPVHVGMAQEKHYQAGLDFLQDDEKISFLNPDALFKALAETPGHLDAVTANMASGDFDKLTKFLKGSQYIKGDVLNRVETISTFKREVKEIRRAYQTGLGQPALPGTSLKGALRSVLVWHLTRPYPDPKVKPDDLFGKIEANLMRYIQMSDVAFDRQDLKVYPVKVFSGDGNPQWENTEGKWKHGNPGNHDPAFMPPHIHTNERSGFFNFYESLKPAQSKSQLRISIANALRGEWLDFARKVPNYAKPLETLTGEKLIELIRKHTAQYLEKERAYYGKFRNDDLGSIETRLAALERHNNSDNSCLLRVGANVGFHSITGDWQDQSRDHYSKWAGTAIKNKTRKFGVEPIDNVNNFLLPGFIKLTLQPTDAAKADSRLQTRQRMTDFGQQIQEEAQQKQILRQKRIEDALKEPEPTYLNKKPRRGDKIDAVVVKTGSPAVQIQLYITEQNKPGIALRYANIAVGKVLTVTVQDASPNGIVNAVAFDSFKKKS